MTQALYAHMNKKKEAKKLGAGDYECLPNWYPTVAWDL
jgi:hypothetical protein